MNLMHLRTFLHVAQLGGFTAAADQLDISKGMVSRHIQSLEEALQCQLLYRTTRSVTLTETGKELFAKAQEIERLAKQAQVNIHDLVQESSGNVKLTAPSALGRAIASEIVQHYVAEYPDVTLSLCFSREIYDVEFGQFDIALRAYDHVPDNVIAKDFGYIKSVLVASPKWLSENPIHQVTDLGHVNVINDLKDQWNTWHLQTATDETVSIRTQSHLICSDYGDALLMAKLGFGIANLPKYVVENALRTGELIQVLPDWYNTVHRLYLTYTKQRSYPKKVTFLIDLIMQWRASHPEWFQS